MANTSTDTKSGNSSASESVKASEKKVIEFTGFSGTRRVITPADFKRAEVEGGPDKRVEWSADNDRKVDVSDWSEEAIALVLRQGEFRLVGAKKAD